MQIGAQPQRRGGDAHILDDAPGIARAQVFFPYADLDMACNIVRGILFVIECGEGERLIEHGGRLPGQAPDAQAVGPVGKHFHIDDLVVDAQDGADIGARDVFFVEYQQTLSTHGGIEILRHVELRGGAKHTIGFYAAQLAGLDLHAAGQFGADQRRGDQDAFLHVGRAADDLKRFALARVHQAYVQVI